MHTHESIRHISYSKTNRPTTQAEYNYKQGMQALDMPFTGLILAVGDKLLRAKYSYWVGEGARVSVNASRGPCSGMIFLLPVASLLRGGATL